MSKSGERGLLELDLPKKNYMLHTIEEKDYRDVSKVVLPLLYPSMFTVTYEECIV